MAELTPERVFNLSQKIRWAGLATDNGEVVFSKMRPGTWSLSPETFDQSFMQMGPMLLTGVCERLVPWAGPLETVTSTYGKVILLVTRVGGRYLALTIGKEDVGILSELIQALSRVETGR